MLAELIYYNKKQPGLGSRFTEAVKEATVRALAFPLAGSPASKNTRRVFLKDFPFAVVYRPAGDDIIVFALAHHWRRPGYWLCEFRIANKWFEASCGKAAWPHR